MNKRSKNTALPYISDNQYRGKILFTVASKTIIYLEKNLIKTMQEVYEENYKTLLKGSFVRPKCHGMNIYLPTCLPTYI